MEKKKASIFIFAVIAIILGITLFKKFDQQTSTFENPWLAAIYAITFMFSIFVIIKGLRSR